MLSLCPELVHGQNCICGPRAFRIARSSWRDRLLGTIRCVRRTSAIPNGLAATRIVLAPLVMLLIVQADRTATTVWWAAALFVVTAFTDFLDGYLARRWDATSILGGFLDSTADKLLVTGSLLALISVNRASIWVALIIIIREFIVVALRGLVAIGGNVIGPSVWGKVKANIQFVAISLAIVRWDVTAGGLFLDEWIMWLAAIVTVASGWGYVTAFWRQARHIDAMP